MNKPMATYADREAFIPYRRTDLIKLCLEEGRLEPPEAEKFKNFCDILTAYYHFELHQSLECLKDNFAPFNPDTDTRLLADPSPAQLQAMETELVQTFETILERANYVSLSRPVLEKALGEKSLIDLNTKVDFADFEQMVFYHRGDTYKTTTFKKFFIKEVEREINIFERVVLLLKFKDEAYFKAKEVKLKDLTFTPGKMYIYLYKNIPKHDLELLFPNVQTSMTWKDRLLFGVPAIGAAIPLVIRVLPQILIVIGVILFFVAGQSVARDIANVDDEAVRNIIPVLLALVSVSFTLGGFAVKQYLNYKNKQIRFQKQVMETLFFQNLNNNAGVFHALIDAAEEEETKEIILVYYHLLTHKEPLTPEELDDHIEQWMAENFDTKIDFDINGPLGNLQALQNQLVQLGADDPQAPKTSLLSQDEQGRCQVLPPAEAKVFMDYLWDNLFRYAA
jgi:hypothetical protein